MNKLASFLLLPLLLGSCSGEKKWKDSLHLTNEKLLDTLNQNFVSLTPSDEEETGAAGEQLVRNNPTGWNGRGGENSPLTTFQFRSAMS